MPDGLGGPRSAFPHTLTLVAGTQAANARQNSLALMKLSDLGQGKHGDKVRASRLEAQLSTVDVVIRMRCTTFSRRKW